MQIPQVVWMVLLSLVNALLIALKIIERRNGKRAAKNNPGDDPPCQEHGEKLARIETEIGNMKDRLGRIEDKLDEAK